MPKNAKFSPIAAKQLDAEFKKLDHEMYKLDLHLARYFTQKDRIRAPYLALLKLVRNHLANAKGEFHERIES